VNKNIEIEILKVGFSLRMFLSSVCDIRVFN